MQLHSFTKRQEEHGEQVAFTCTYRVDGLPYGVTLYGLDEHDVIAKHSKEYPDLIVNGRMIGGWYM